VVGTNVVSEALLAVRSFGWAPDCIKGKFLDKFLFNQPKEAGDYQSLAGGAADGAVVRDFTAGNGSTGGFHEGQGGPLPISVDVDDGVVYGGSVDAQFVDAVGAVDVWSSTRYGAVITAFIIVITATLQTVTQIISTVFDQKAA
jgi:hypothetical protein